MCGICGLFLFDRDARVALDMLQTMNRSMVHRGPDDEGYHVEGRVGLAMRRLSIIDLAGGHQPISNEDGSVHVVYNGEIYNYDILREDLLARGHTLRTRSDTEVIVHLYEDMGEECVTRLNGMFAFALWDSKRGRLVLARDRLGIKPLFYAHEPGARIVFGSEMKAVFPAGVSLEPDYQALYDYLSLMCVPTPSTAYASIKKLPPASVMVCDGSNVSIRSYWDIPLPDRGQEDPPASDLQDRLVDLIQAAVQRHMIADVPVGALLSGGLDSTMVTAIMASKLGIPVKTFTMGFDKKSYDEAPEAQLVADTLHTEHFQQIGRPEMVDSLTKLLTHFDEPFADYSAIPTYLVSKMAAERVKVVLTGDGGDEVFAGYPTHVAYRVVELMRYIPRGVREGLIAPLVRALPTSMERISFDYKAKRFITGIDLPFERGHYWWKVIFDEKRKAELLTQDFLDLGLRDTFEVFDRHFRACERAHPLNRLLYVDAKTFLLDDNLVKVDRMTMANSLEARVPLLDHELVETVARIHPGAKTRGLRTKHLLRQAAEGLLPSAIRKGKKKGFTPPLPFWIQHELKGFILDMLSSHRLRATGMLNETYCHRLLEEHFRGAADHNREIWTLVSLICWAENCGRKGGDT